VWPGASRLLEESGELNQVLGKLIGAGGVVEHWDGSNLRDRLIEELGDVAAAVEFFVAASGLSVDEVNARKAKKLDRYWSWHFASGASEGVAR
jgi:NTP pyrophosphatase (non-canonical NTP hydrolase)